MNSCQNWVRFCRLCFPRIRTDLPLMTEGRLQERRSTVESIELRSYSLCRLNSTTQYFLAIKTGWTWQETQQLMSDSQLSGDLSGILQSGCPDTRKCLVMIENTWPRRVSHCILLLQTPWSANSTRFGLWEWPPPSTPPSHAVALIQRWNWYVILAMMCRRHWEGVSNFH